MARQSLIACILLVGACLCCVAQASSAQEPTHSIGEKVLDRVVAVVNNQVILESDIGLETRLIHLLPVGDASESTAPKALERLITRALIEQQILLEDPHGMEVAPKETADALLELRQSLPACKHRDCSTTEGWRSYLATLDLTPAQVESYWSNRIAILRFIEQRFRSGIRITPEEIETYYQNDLVPRYMRPEDAPPLERLSPRIQEILLQQRVNGLMNDWLKSLQSQGQVEVLDASLRLPGESHHAPETEAPVTGPAIPRSSLPGTVPPSAVVAPGMPADPSDPATSPSPSSNAPSGSAAPPGAGGADERF